MIDRSTLDRGPTLAGPNAAPNKTKKSSAHLYDALDPLLKLQARSYYVNVDVHNRPGA